MLQNNYVVVLQNDYAMTLHNCLGVAPWHWLINTTEISEHSLLHSPLVISSFMSEFAEIMSNDEITWGFLSMNPSQPRCDLFLVSNIQLTLHLNKPRFYHPFLSRFSPYLGEYLNSLQIFHFSVIILKMTSRQSGHLVWYEPMGSEVIKSYLEFREKFKQAGWFHFFHKL